MKPDVIRVPKQSFSFIDAVTNPFAATGGCDMESVEQLDATSSIEESKQGCYSRGLEWLAMEASNSVARVRAMANPSVWERSPWSLSHGCPQAMMSTFEKPFPLNCCVGYHVISMRRLLTTIVRVVRPRYADISLSLKIVRPTRVPVAE